MHSIVRMLKIFYFVFLLGALILARPSACMSEQNSNSIAETPQTSNADPAMNYREWYYTKYLVERANIELATYRWQRHASETLMWMVGAICLSGVLFSGYQLWTAARLPRSHHRPPSPADSTSKGNGSTETTLEFSIERFKITSSVVGLVVLAMSLAFFYLFVTNIYLIDSSPTSHQSEIIPKGG